MGIRDEKEKTKVRKEKLAGYFFDISKLCFGAMALGGLTSIITGETNFKNVLFLLLGIVMTFAFAMVGNRILKY